MSSPVRGIGRLMGQWDPDIDYCHGDVVSDQACVWERNARTAKKPTKTKKRPRPSHSSQWWTLLSRIGPQGPQGPSGPQTPPLATGGMFNPSTPFSLILQAYGGGVVSPGSRSFTHTFTIEEEDLLQEYPEKVEEILTPPTEVRSLQEAMFRRRGA